MSITQPIYKATPVLGIPHKWRLVDSEIRRRFLRITKRQDGDGSTRIARSDIYGGSVVPFVPFTKLQGDAISGTHNQ